MTVIQFSTAFEVIYNHGQTYLLMGLGTCSSTRQAFSHDCHTRHTERCVTTMSRDSYLIKSDA